MGKKAVLCDLDVDVPDMHILLNPQVQQREVFISGSTARINPDLCTACGRCAELCRFDAVHLADGVYSIDELACGGLRRGVTSCARFRLWNFRAALRPVVCERNAFGPFVHAQLDPGQENSGDWWHCLSVRPAKSHGRGGRACAVRWFARCGLPCYRSLSGAALAVAVVEPTPSGRHDFGRVAELCAHFRIPVAVLIQQGRPQRR